MNSKTSNSHISDTKVKFMTVCMPTHQMKGGDVFLRQSLDILAKQSFKDFDIVISDHSKTNFIKDVCDRFKDKLDIHYYRNPKGPFTSSANLNNAISKAKGKLIKVLFLDDYLYSEDSLKDIVDNFDLEKDKWLLTGSEHTTDGIHLIRPFYPKYHDRIHLGENTISSPSVLTIKNDKPLLFDKRMIWLMDCDYYKRCYQKFGPPKILNKINAVNRNGDHQVSNTSANKARRGKEYLWVLKKFHEKDLLKKYYEREIPKQRLDKVTLVAVAYNNLRQTLKALEFSMDGIDYNEVILISNERPQYLKPGIKFKQCPKFSDYDEHDRFVTYDLADYINSSFALIVGHNNYVIRPYKWEDSFLQYDYVGKSCLSDDVYKNILNDGDDFSLRSKELLTTLKSLNFKNIDKVEFQKQLKVLARSGIKIAPVEVATKFVQNNFDDQSSLEPFGFSQDTRLIPKLFFLKKRFKKLRLINKIKVWLNIILGEPKFGIIKN